MPSYGREIRSQFRLSTRVVAAPAWLIYPAAVATFVGMPLAALLRWRQTRRDRHLS